MQEQHYLMMLKYELSLPWENPLQIKLVTHTNLENMQGFPCR